MACGWNRNTKQQNSRGHCSNRIFVNSRHGLWSIYTNYTIGDSACTHTCAPLVTLTWFLTSGKCWPCVVGQTGTRNSKTVVGIAATAYLWIGDMHYDQYRPLTPLDTLFVPIHVPLWSLWLHSSPVAKDGLWVKKEHETAKQWWTLQQAPNCEFRKWIMINIDQLHNLKISWHSYMCFFSHFDSFTHQWQMMASGSNMNKQQHNSSGHCSKRIFVTLRWGLWSILTSQYTIGHTACTHTCAFLVTLTQFLTRRHGLLSIQTSYTWENTKQQNSGGNCSKCQIVNSGTGLW
jgi:hypothetical protein